MYDTMAAPGSPAILLRVNSPETTDHPYKMLMNKNVPISSPPGPLPSVPPGRCVGTSASLSTEQVCSVLGQGPETAMMIPTLLCTDYLQRISCLSVKFS